jgi:catechol 2,3-dioxygenase-like lactoylglutathione lyase family enzyme
MVGGDVEPTPVRYADSMNEPHITGLAGVLLHTSPERHPAMAEFYRDILGLHPRTNRPGFVNFEWGPVRLTVTTHSDIDGEANDPHRTMVNLETADIARTADHLRAAGVEFVRPPSQEPWGGWIATFRDPDGNLVQLLQTR